MTCKEPFIIFYLSQFIVPLTRVILRSMEKKQELHKRIWQAEG